MGIDFRYFQYVVLSIFAIFLSGKRRSQKKRFNEKKISPDFVFLFYDFFCGGGGEITMEIAIRVARRLAVNI